MEVSPKLWIFIASQVFGILSVIMVLSHSLSGTMDWSLDFKWHPVLMVLSMVYLMGTSITIYRGLSWMEKFHLKVIHGVIHIAALLFAIAGVVIMYDAERYTTNLSLHSLFGLISVVLLGVQWIMGMGLYLYPAADPEIKGHAMPYHIIIGLTTFILGCFATLIGLNSFTTGPMRTSPVVEATFGGFFIVFFFLLVLYLTTKEKYKREAMPSD